MIDGTPTSVKIASGCALVSALFRSLLGAVLFVGIWALFVQSPVHASASPWVAGDQADTRLVASRASVPGDAQTVRVGWQVRLAPGWKTYWRAPGDAGLPPAFDWSGSENVANVSVDWPTPERLNLFGLDTAIYDREVVLPMTVTLATAGKPVLLRLDVDFMVCERICVPLTAEYRLHLPAGDGAPGAGHTVIARFEGRVPTIQTELGEGDAHDGGLRILDARLTDAGIEIRVRANDGHNLDAFVAGPDKVSFGRAQVRETGDRVGDTDDDAVHLLVPVRGARGPDLAGQELIIVIARGKGADGREATEWRGRLEGRKDTE